jgi:hypothetical protein
MAILDANEINPSFQVGNFKTDEYGWDVAGNLL